MPEVTTYSPLFAWVFAGRYCSSRSLGSPTFGCTMPVAVLVPMRAETPIVLSVIRSTWAPSGSTATTLPTSPSPLITGSLTRTPSGEPLSIVTVEYQMLGLFPTTVAVTGW